MKLPLLFSLHLNEYLHYVILADSKPVKFYRKTDLFVCCIKYKLSYLTNILYRQKTWIDCENTLKIVMHWTNYIFVILKM